MSDTFKGLIVTLSGDLRQDSADAIAKAVLRINKMIDEEKTKGGEEDADGSENGVPKALAPSTDSR